MTPMQAFNYMALKVNETYNFGYVSREEYIYCEEAKNTLRKYLLEKEKEESANEVV